MAENWTEVELEASVEAYLWMLEMQNRKQDFVKAQVARDLIAGALFKRTKKAIEYRWMNISAVRQVRGEPLVDGYKPAKNVGVNVTIQIESILDDLQNSQVGLSLPDVYSKTSSRTTSFAEPPIGNPSPLSVKVSSSGYQRNAGVREYVLQEANGHCVGCDRLAPFIKTNGEPYLEVHHLDWLRNGGADTVENAIALCPNCHARCHLSSDHERFTKFLKRKKKLSN